MLGLAPILKLRCQQGPVATVVLKLGQAWIKPCSLLVKQGHGLRIHQHLTRRARMTSSFEMQHHGKSLHGTCAALHAMEPLQ